MRPHGQNPAAHNKQVLEGAVYQHHKHSWSWNNPACCAFEHRCRKDKPCLRQSRSITQVSACNMSQKHLGHEGVGLDLDPLCALSISEAGMHTVLHALSKTPSINQLPPGSRRSGPGSCTACCALSISEAGMHTVLHALSNNHMHEIFTWITKEWSWILPACVALSISLMANTVPRPVAASRPRLPCRCTGCSADTARIGQAQ
jgi:hypothetical protein